jgi:hypothetical protein
MGQRRAALRSAIPTKAPKRKTLLERNALKDQRQKKDEWYPQTR